MLAVGPYEFTLTDARRTLGNLPAWWLELVRGRRADAVSGIGVRLGELSQQAGDDDLAAPLTEAWHLLLEAAAALRPQAARGRGTVAQLNRSGGGVPKLPVEEVTVTWRGVEGDRQASRVHHGRPWQALCLWSTEVIDALAGEGHPIHPGAAGENVTINGLEWSDVRPGDRLRVGEVLCETSMFTLPCSKNAQWFLGGDFNRMHHDQGPWSRIYATVLEPGQITTGDPVTLNP